MTVLRDHIRALLAEETKASRAVPELGLWLPKNFNDLIEKKYPAYAIPDEEWDEGSISWWMHAESIEDAWQKRNQEISGDKTMAVAKTASGVGGGMTGVGISGLLYAGGLIVDALGGGGMASLALKLLGAKGIFLSIGHEALKKGGFDTKLRREFQKEIRWDENLLKGIKESEAEAVENAYMEYFWDMIKNKPHAHFGVEFEDINDFYLRTSESDMLQPTGTRKVRVPSQDEKDLAKLIATNPSAGASNRLRGRDSREAQAGMRQLSQNELRKYIRSLLSESTQYDDHFKPLMDSGYDGIKQAIELADSLGMSPRELPWNDDTLNAYLFYAPGEDTLEKLTKIGWTTEEWVEQGRRAFEDRERELGLRESADYDDDYSSSMEAMLAMLVVDQAQDNGAEQALMMFEPMALSDDPEYQLDLDLLAAEISQRLQPHTEKYQKYDGVDKFGVLLVWQSTVDEIIKFVTGDGINRSFRPSWKSFEREEDVSEMLGPVLRQTVTAWKKKEQGKPAMADHEEEWVVRECVRRILTEQINSVLDKIVKLVETGHGNQAFEIMVMMPEELDTATVITTLRKELANLRAITRSPEPGSWAFAKHRPKPPDPEWDKFARFARGFSDFIGFTGGDVDYPRMLDPNNHNPQHRARPRDPLAKTHEWWPSAEDMIQMLQQKIGGETIKEAARPNYVTGHGIFDDRSPTENEKKLLDVFVGSGAQALELAELTGHDELASWMHKIIDPIRERIKTIEDTVALIQSDEITERWKIEDISIKLENEAEEILRGYYPSSKLHDSWEDSVFEMADYIWYHGVDYDSYNVASETKSKQDLDKIKMWAGVA